MMQQGTTILQYLTFRPNVSFNDPATPHGKLWNAALKHVTQTQGWGELDWGARVASEQVVDLLISKINTYFAIPTSYGWGSHTDLLHFMTHEYQAFLNIFNALLLPGTFTPSPLILRLHPGMPNLDLGTVSSVYELSFNVEVDENTKTGLHIQKQLCRSMFMDAAEDVGDGFEFLNLDAAWALPYHEIEVPTPSSDITDSTSSGEQNRHKKDKRSQPQTLLIIADWARSESERLISNSGKIDDHTNSGLLTAGEYFAKNMLQTADHYTNHRVVFENVSKVNVAWLDKEEKWSTYVARLLAEEAE